MFSISVMTYDIMFGKTYIKGVGWCSGINMDFTSVVAGSIHTKRVREREFVINI